MEKDRSAVKLKIRCGILSRLRKLTGKWFVPVGVSNRHVHLSAEDLEKLFGKGYQLENVRPLSQPNQFVAKEKVDISGPKGIIQDVRVLGPVREQTQVEISVTDSYRIGKPAVVRMSGELKDTPGVCIIGPRGTIELEAGLIVAARHLHLSGDQAEEMGLRDGDVVNLAVPGNRAMVLQNVMVRAGSAHEMELHIDVDEANAAQIKNGDILEII